MHATLPSVRLAVLADTTTLTAGGRERLDPDTGIALRLRTVAQDDGDELLRLLILAVLAKADRPMDAEELAERVAAMMGVRLSPERGH